MTNTIIAIIALGCLGLFLAVVVIWVPQPALIVVCAVSMGMAGYDFYRMLVVAPRQKAAEQMMANKR
ncbi:MAG: hypothetical protein H2045_09275 [Rhizobiales bacterium]|nr:hypothetical protein [Hyphomicrobiales bacterium]